jgi:hypothetical protein
MQRIRQHNAAAFACAVLSALAVTAAGCGEDECELDAVSRRLGGTGLIDCGLAVGDPEDVDRCAVVAHGGGSTFRALYQREDGGVDAIMRVAGGAYVVLRFDAESGRIERADCEDGRITVGDGRTFVDCVDQSDYALVCE